MSYTFGFDFGTHQTKICVEDSSNPFEKIYEFIAFEKLDGTATVLFPSVVQINEDDTLSYGFVDENRCKVIRDGERPTLKLLDLPPIVGNPRKPVPEYPPKPKTSSFRKEKLDEWKKSVLNWKKK